jgi:hypothetical protein
LMETSEHIGKIVLEVRPAIEHLQLPVHLSERSHVPERPRVRTAAAITEGSSFWNFCIWIS